MNLSKESIAEFQKIWQEEYGENIPESEAAEKAARFMNLFKIVYQPIRNQNDKENSKTT